MKGSRKGKREKIVKDFHRVLPRRVGAEKKEVGGMVLEDAEELIGGTKIEGVGKVEVNVFADQKFFRLVPHLETT